GEHVGELGRAQTSLSILGPGGIPEHGDAVVGTSQLGAVTVHRLAPLGEADLVAELRALEGTAGSQAGAESTPRGGAARARSLTAALREHDATAGLELLQAAVVGTEFAIDLWRLHTALETSGPPFQQDGWCRVVPADGDLAEGAPA